MAAGFALGRATDDRAPSLKREAADGCRPKSERGEAPGPEERVGGTASLPGWRARRDQRRDGLVGKAIFISKVAIGVNHPHSEVRRSCAKFLCPSLEFSRVFCVNDGIIMRRF
jgi:hypothetical protein